ncbi:hypothetical protein C8R45DRAFT_568744 [Mycena sanguinolenta]|nr:hypothetical protein C8R45DRAFT_568744 [Mycena sanguinolenta]
MQTLARQLQDAGRLGGSFFFKRGHAPCGNGQSLFSTIAYQLALDVECLRTPISQVVEQNPSILARSIRTQMRKLISEPFCNLKHREPVLILIDGLDECEGDKFQQAILRVIRNSSSNHTFPFRFIVASRPEPHIREVFDSSYFGPYRPFNVEQSFDDVRKYLRDEFARIHRTHDTMRKLPRPWPSDDVLEKLVEKSSGHFIYASTIIKFIDDKNYRPTERLAVVQDASSPESKSAFDTLDQLYMTILRSASRQAQLIPILCAIIHFELAAGNLDRLFGLADGETRLILRGLHSVLNVPRDDKEAISSHHASFVDFLKHPDRSRKFCVGTLNHQISLARCLLHFYAGPFQYTNFRFLSGLIRFITSLPPSGRGAELIGSINPHYIFNPEEDKLEDDFFGSIIPWLKNTPSAPVRTPSDLVCSDHLTA